MVYRLYSGIIDSSWRQQRPGIVKGRPVKNYTLPWLITSEDLGLMVSMIIEPRHVISNNVAF